MLRLKCQVYSFLRYARAVYAVVVCLSASLSVKSKYCIETTGRTEIFFDIKASFHTLCYNRVPPKPRVFLSGTLSQTLDSENFAAAIRSCCQQNSSTVELVDNTYDDRRIAAAHYMSVNCKPLTPLPQHLLQTWISRLANPLKCAD